MSYQLRKIVLGGAFAAFFLVKTTAGIAQPAHEIAARTLAELVYQVQLLQAARDVCLWLYPEEASVIAQEYGKSTVGAYAELLGIEYDLAWLEEVDEPLGFEADDEKERDELLSSLGMSEAEASRSCFVQLRSDLQRFDERYRTRFEELRVLNDALAHALEQAAARQRTARGSAPLDSRVLALVERIVEAYSYAYDTGDWSMLTTLYRPGVLDCWADVDPSHGYSFLSGWPIPETATVRVEPFTGYGRRFPLPEPTHFMELSYERASDGRTCGQETRRTWPRYHFFLLEYEGGYELTHYCPTTDSSEWGEVPAHALSATRIAAVTAALQAKEWDDIPSTVVRRGDLYPNETVARLREEYGVSWNEAQAMIDFVCDPANERPFTP